MSENKKDFINPLIFHRKKEENYITVGEFKEHLNNYDDNDVIIMSKDEEGNKYSPLDEGMESIYEPECTWSGNIHYLDDMTSEEIEEKYGEDIKNGNLVKCIVLYPIN